MSSRPKDIARAHKLQPRPKSVGWNPFNNTNNASPKRRRSRSNTTDNNTTTNTTTNTLQSSYDTNNSAIMNQSNHNHNHNHNLPNSPNGLPLPIEPPQQQHQQQQQQQSTPTTPYLAVSHLSQLPDEQVWENLSTMSLRDLAAGHHFVAPPPSEIHPSLDTHLQEVDRLESYDKRRRMMNNLSKREEARWRLTNRKRERIAIQSYCSQPILHIPDPNVQLNVTQPMTVGQVLRSKYQKTHPPPSYNVKVYRKLKKHADLRALKMILSRFDASEKHDDHVSTIKDYTRGLSRGDLKVSAMKRSELETRLGTPFALSGTSIYSKPGTGIGRSRSRGSLRRNGSHGGLNGHNGGRGGGRGSRKIQTAGNGRSNGFGLGAFDTPAGVATPGEMLSMPVLHGSSSAPETNGIGGIGGIGGISMQSMPNMPNMQGTTSTNDMIEDKTLGTSMIDTSGSAILRKPIWQRNPHEHWKPPSHYLRTLEKTATSKKKRRKSKGGRPPGFPQKYLYPMEVVGLDTLFPEN